MPITSYRPAIARILSDLIKADTIIDVGELEKYAIIRERYKLTQMDEQEAITLSLAEAINRIGTLPQKKRESLLNECFELAVSDGFCASSEALLLLAYKLCISEDASLHAEVISIETPNVHIEDNQVIYIENSFHQKYNQEISQSYRAISNEFRLAGFNFVYIPKVASHYRHYNQNTFQNVISFLAPHLSSNEIDALVHNLSFMTTTTFCQEQLYRHLGMASLQHCNPSFIIRISTNFVSNTPCSNYLRIEIADTVMQTVKIIVDIFKKRLSADAIVIPNTDDIGDQFLYQGFYKQLFDMYTIKPKPTCSLDVDFSTGKLRIPEINSTITGLRRKEKAFYVLLALKSKDGGINFNSPQSAEQLQDYNKRMDQIKNNYASIYYKFGGKQLTVPNIEDPDIRRPMVSAIRKNVAELAKSINNYEQFNIHKDSNGNFRILLPCERINYSATIENIQ